MQDITNAIEFITTYWWQLLLGLVFGFTLLSIIIKFFIEKITLLLIKIFVFIVSLPFKLISYFPKLSILIIMGLALYFILK